MQLGETFFTENRLCCTHTHFFLPPCCCWPLSCDWAHLFREKFLQDVKLLFKLKSFSLSSCLLSLSPSIFLPLSIKKIILESLLLKPKHANSLFTLSRTKSFWLSFLPRSLSVSHSFSRSAERNDQSMILFEYQVSNLFMIFDKNSNHDKCDDGVCSFKINVSVNAFKNVRSKWSPPFYFSTFWALLKLASHLPR